MSRERSQDVSCLMNDGAQDGILCRTRLRDISPVKIERVAISPRAYKRGWLWFVLDTNNITPALPSNQANISKNLNFIVS